MYEIELLNTSIHVVTTFVARGDEAVFVAVESNYKDPGMSAADKMVAIRQDIDKRVTESSWGPELPRILAEQLAPSFEGYLFAGIFLRLGDPGRMWACGAGDLRIHVVDGAALTFVSRVHNLIEDRPKDMKVNEADELKAVHAGVVTRCLGNASMAPPELFEAAISADSVIVVVSSLIHRYEGPTAYLDALMGGDRSRLDKWPGLYAAMRYKR